MENYSKEDLEVFEEHKFEATVKEKEDVPVQHPNEELGLHEEEEVVSERNNKKEKRKNKYRIQGKSFLLTYPRCKTTKESCLKQLSKKRAPSYLCVGHEKHKDGEDHLHAFVQYAQKESFYKPDCFDLEDKSHGNYQSARSSDDARKYCMKDGDYLEWGAYLSNRQTEVQKRAADNKKILTTPLPELVNSGEISLYSYQQLRTAKNLYTLDSLVVPDYMPKECIWIYGATGIGKSRYIRDNFPGQFFNKSQNKWWDGYNGEKIVLLDDFDLKGETLGHYLKIWGDCYSFSAEIKGGTIKPSIEKFFITSQYLPRDIFCQGNDETKWDQEMRKAIERRFKIMTIGRDGISLIEY